MTHLRFCSSSMVESPCAFVSPLSRPPGIGPCLVFKQTARELERNIYVLLRYNKNASAQLLKKPWTHSFVEPECALWRLSHLLLAAENQVCKEPFANVCHLALGNFPVILIGGFLQDWCLSICPDSARAAHPRLQENVLQTGKLPNFCLLLIHQLRSP